MKIFCLLGFHKWIYSNVSHKYCFKWERKCEKCGRHEITNRSGNTLLYDREDAEYLRYYEINEMKEKEDHEYKMREKLFK